MLKGKDLLEALCPNGVAIEDVLVLLNDCFATVRGEKKAITYSQDEKSYALRVEYENGKVVAITAGESLEAVTLDKILRRVQAEVVESPGWCISRRYLFSKLPLAGCWRYEDQFQIQPIPEEAPQPPSIIAPQPFVLEFRVRTSTNALLESQRRARQVQRIVNLLNAMCSCRIWTTSLKLQFRWAAVEESTNPIQCVSEAYRVPDELVDQATWTSLDHLPPIERVSPQDGYYNPLRRVGDTLKLPVDAEEYVRVASSLEGDRLERFRRATYWLGYAEEASFISESAAFVGLATAIECILPSPDRSTTCEKCGRSTGPGPTANFKKFLEMYLPRTAELRSARRELYSLRSDLAHGWNVFQADLDLLSHMHPDRFAQWMATLDLEKVTRWVLHNWLLERTTN